MFVKPSSLKDIDYFGRTSCVMFQRLPGPVKFSTARRLICDTFNIADTHAMDVCEWLIDNGYAKNDGGWLVML